MRPTTRSFRSSLPLRSFAGAVALGLFAACATHSGGLLEPKATDPLDGYKGSYAEAGVNTEVDWGPKQNLLLTEYTSLKEAHQKLQRRVEQLVAENANLTTRIGNEATSLEREKSLRAQAEAETELLRNRRRELEARILNLSIEKARLEQAELKARIDALNAAAAAAEGAEAAQSPPAAPPRNR
ncbi:MAG: hypothetical protein ACK5AL_05345 [Planctomycetota bacterium]|jgi:septal ring factor EnvC (AmiA/AmiB activator)